MVRLLLLAALVLPAAASAQGASISQQSFDAEGDPVLSAAGSIGALQWDICPPDAAACTSAGTGQTIMPGNQPTDTVFVLTVDADGFVSQDVSDPWGGQVGAVTAPRVKGRPFVGRAVAGRPAEWEGGWPGDYGFQGLLLCRDPEGADCKTIFSERYDFTEPFELKPRMAGRYLIPTDERLSLGHSLSLEVFDRVQRVPPPANGPTVAFGDAIEVLGPVASLRRTVTRSGLLGNVNCPYRCEVRTRYTTPATRGFAQGSAFFITRGRGRLPLVRPAGLPPGKRRATVTVTVDGFRIARRKGVRFG